MIEILAVGFIIIFGGGFFLTTTFGNSLETKGINRYKSQTDIEDR